MTGARRAALLATAGLLCACAPAPSTTSPRDDGGELVEERHEPDLIDGAPPTCPEVLAVPVGPPRDEAIHVEVPAGCTVTVQLQLNDTTLVEAAAPLAHLSVN
ncbi:MAG: hypothetical protein ACO3JL_17460, partial [Myxococcota bacterium]